MEKKIVKKIWTKKAKIILDKNRKKELNWDIAIEDIKVLIQEAQDRDRMRLLQAIVIFFKEMKDDGVPWPGENRKDIKKPRR